MATLKSKNQSPKPQATSLKKKEVKDTKKVVDNLNFKSAAELLEMARNLRREIGLTRLAIRAGREQKVRLVFTKRKELARVLTALNAKRADKQPQTEV